MIRTAVGRYPCFGQSATAILRCACSNEHISRTFDRFEAVRMELTTDNHGDHVNALHMPRIRNEQLITLLRMRC